MEGFVGKVIQANQSVTYEFPAEDISLNLNSATLDYTANASEAHARTTLYVEYEPSNSEIKSNNKKKNKNTRTSVALCTLTPGTNDQCTLSQMFVPSDGVLKFYTKGAANTVHLSAFQDIAQRVDAEPEDFDDDDEEEEEDNENPRVQSSMPTLADMLREQFVNMDEYESEDDSTFDESDSDSGESMENEDEKSSDAEIEEEPRVEILEERIHTAKELDQVDTKKTKGTTPTPTLVSLPTSSASTPSTTTKEAKSSTTNAATIPDSVDPKKATHADEAKKSTSKNANKRKADEMAAFKVESSKKKMRNVRGVQLEDIVIGAGAAVKKGRRLSILYHGKLENGKVFDSCTNRKKPFTFRLGVGDVIRGMDIGVEGMRSGGKRTLHIPANLAYGLHGAPPAIPPNAPLIFEIELL